MDNDTLITEIKKKKELSDLPDSLVKETLQNYLNKNKLSIPKNEKELKIVIKEIRSQLRRYAGQYQKGFSLNKKSSLLHKGEIGELLKSHSSTKERIDFYPKLTQIINSFKPESILDLGCGLNPLAIAKKGLIYYAYDIKQSDLDLVSEFFRMRGIKGKVFCQDLRKINSFPKTDLTLIFKFLDIVEKDKYNFSKSLLKKISSPNIIVSFSTKTLSGRPMNSPRREWFEKLLVELQYKYESIISTNEIFYIIEKGFKYN